MNETTMTLAGNLVSDPELRYTPTGTAVANFRVASTERFKDGDGWKDGATLFLTVNAWRQLAENVAESAHRGDRVVVTGRLRQREYETREGDKRTVFEVEATDVGMSLLRGTTKMSRSERATAPAANGEAVPEEPPF